MDVRQSRMAADPVVRTEHIKPETELRASRYLGNHRRVKLRSKPGNERSDVQRCDGIADGLEWHKHNGASAKRGDYGERRDDGRGSDEQWNQFHGNVTAPEYYQSESDLWRSGNCGDPDRYEFRSNPGQQHGDLQRDRRHGDKLERHEYHRNGPNGRHQWQCGSDCGRRGQQRDQLHRDYYRSYDH